ncbi:basic proline-rich protein-like [Corvus hawaiiensis]|uniref:basic proline-rich protein-like n=1 Tax=Corvus hawaiiensis TaxID=134902 RepID=UPI0020197997|nr:basic proline-rich protein-like [Corvus hawaiiensis]
MGGGGRGQAWHCPQQLQGAPDDPSNPQGLLGSSCPTARGVQGRPRQQNAAAGARGVCHFPLKLGNSKTQSGRNSPLPSPPLPPPEPQPGHPPTDIRQQHECGPASSGGVRGGRCHPRDPRDPRAAPAELLDQRGTDPRVPPDPVTPGQALPPGSAPGPEPQPGLRPPRTRLDRCPHPGTSPGSAPDPDPAPPTRPEQDPQPVPRARNVLGRELPIPAGPRGRHS